MRWKPECFRNSRLDGCASAWTAPRIWIAASDTAWWKPPSRWWLRRSTGIWRHDVLTRWEAAELRVKSIAARIPNWRAAAERLRALVRASTLDWWGDRLRVTISVGGATAEPGDTHRIAGSAGAAKSSKAAGPAGGDRARRGSY